MLNSASMGASHRESSTVQRRETPGRQSRDRRSEDFPQSARQNPNESGADRSRAGKSCDGRSYRADRWCHLHDVAPSDVRIGQRYLATSKNPQIKHPGDELDVPLRAFRILQGLQLRFEHTVGAAPLQHSGTGRSRRLKVHGARFPEPRPRTPLPPLHSFLVISIQLQGYRANEGESLSRGVSNREPRAGARCISRSCACQAVAPEARDRQADNKEAGVGSTLPSEQVHVC